MNTMTKTDNDPTYSYSELSEESKLYARMDALSETDLIPKYWYEGHVCEFVERMSLMGLYIKVEDVIVSFNFDSGLSFSGEFETGKKLPDGLNPLMGYAHAQQLRNWHAIMNHQGKALKGDIELNNDFEMMVSAHQAGSSKKIPSEDMRIKTLRMLFGDIANSFYAELSMLFKHKNSRSFVEYHLTGDRPHSKMRFLESGKFVPPADAVYE